MEPRQFNQCPVCRSTAYWRTGLHFDYEMRCPKCDHCFDPNELWVEEEAERLYYNTHRE